MVGIQEPQGRIELPSLFDLRAFSPGIYDTMGLFTFEKNCKLNYSYQLRSSFAIEDSFLCLT